MPANLLLSSLPRELQDLIAPELETVYLPTKAVAMRPGEVINDVFFPTSGLISVVVDLKDGGTVETLTTSYEGFSGITLLLGERLANRNAFVQVAGEFKRMDAKTFLELQRTHLEFRNCLEGYARYAFKVIEQSAACLAYHPLNNRLARWLLSVADRLQRGDLPLTHEFLSQMLGVYRPSVTIAIGQLQQSGLIEQRRGLIRVIDRERLEDAACECYSITRFDPLE